MNALIPIFQAICVFWIHEAIAFGSVVGNVINFVPQCGIFVCHESGSNGCSKGNSYLTGYKSYNRCGYGSSIDKSKNSPERMSSRRILGQIIKIGFPSACETALYNIAMTLVVRFMNQMDTNGMNVTARSYAMQIANFSYCIGATLAQANAIMTGWRIGAKEYEQCDRGTRKAAIYGVITATCFSVTFAVLGKFIVHIFTDDPQMISLVVKPCL